MQNSKYKIQNTKFKMKSAKLKVILGLVENLKYRFENCEF